MENVYDHGRYAVEITYTAGVYEALTDGRGNPIPFLLNVEEAGTVEGTLEDASADVTISVAAGTNADKFISITQSGTTATGLLAVYPYKPATTTIKTTE